MSEQESTLYKYALFQASAAVQTTSLLFCDVRQRRLVISNRRLATAFRTHL